MEILSPLSFIVLLFLLLSFSGATNDDLPGSGDGGDGGDNEDDDNNDIICINPLNLSSLHPSYFYEGSNFTLGLQHGSCISACLNQLILDNTLFQEFLTFDNGLLILSPLSPILQDNQSCHIWALLMQCSKGCYYSSTVKANTSLCDSLCYDSCSGNEVCSSDCDEDVCITGCSIPFSMTQELSSDTITLPTMEIKETSTLGVFKVNWTMNGVERLKEDQTKEWANTTWTLLLNITAVSYDGMNKTTIFKNIPALFTELDLREYICSKVHLSYSWVSPNGSYYNNGTVSILNVKGVNVTQPIAISAITISRYYSYDYRRGFFGHFVVNISWDNPPDMVSISHYKIVIDHAQHYNRCRNAIFDVMPDFNNMRTNYLIRAEDPDDPPFARCQYNLKIVSMPVHSSFNPASAVWYLSLPNYEPDDLIISCSHQLKPNGLSYVVHMSVQLTPYIANEEVIDKISVIPDLIEYGSSGNVIDQDAGALVDFNIDTNETDYHFVLNSGFYPQSTNNFKYELSVSIEWLNLIAFKPIIQNYKCSFNPLSPLPGPITDVRLLAPVSKPNSYSVHLSLSWSPPTSFNGVFKLYELVLVTDPKNGSEEISQSSQTPRKTIEQVDLTTDVWVPQFIPRDDVHCMYIQIRAHNGFRGGNWSVPLLIPLDEECLPSTIETMLPSITAAITSATTPGNTASNTAATTAGTNTAENTASNTAGTNTAENTAGNIPASTAWNTAVSTAASTVASTTSSAITVTKPTSTSSSTGRLSPAATTGLGFGIVLILLLICSLFVLCLFWQMRRRKRRLEFIQEDIFSDPIFHQMGPRTTVNFISLTENAVLHDDWEIPAAMVILECEIGQGEFGEVYRGMLTDPTVTPHTRKILKETYSSSVAVKLLKPSATGSEKKDFLNEIELMKQISQGHNSHVVNMVGCVTAQEPLCLITEFVKHGDLLSYLRATRKRIPEDKVNPYPDLGELQSSDLLSFAYQIATGMEFLSSLDIVHRDLACRNVLIGDSKNLKISDYGMSRMVQAGDTYVKSTKGKLPLKWMAIESITDREFTSASDVWAYGVTLWEIGTLGGFPYPTVGNDELLIRLKQGYRMECPDNCSKEIYDIMLECWNESPLKRPTFSVLRQKVDKLLSAQQSNAYIDLRTDEGNDIYTAPPEEEEEEQMNKMKRGSSNSNTSLSSSANENDPLRASNPLFLEIETTSGRSSLSPPPSSSPLHVFPNGSAKPHETSSLYLSPRATPKPSPIRLIPSPRRPISLALWDGAKENPYVDEPAGKTGGVGRVGGGGKSGSSVVPVIRVSASTPSSPTHSKQDAHKE